jgi:hypothetical protein
MSEIDKKYAALGGTNGFLGAPKAPETAAPDGVGRFRQYAFGMIYWHPETGAHEVHGAVRTRWAQMGSEKSPLGYPTTDETLCPDKVGKFNHFQHGSIYHKPTVSAHEVHGPIHKLWASKGWEKNPSLGYPISDELPTSPGSKNRYSDFENGVVYWKHGAANASQLSKLVLNNASKSASEVLSEIKKIVVPLIKQKVDGHQIYITKGPFFGGPNTLGAAFSPANILEWGSPVTDYRFDGAKVHNRFYKVRTELGIEVPVTADISAVLDLHIEIFFDKATRKVMAAARGWWVSVHVPWPTSWGVSAKEVVDQFKLVVNPQMNKTHEVAKVDGPINVLSIKPMPNGDLDVYIEPLL